MAKHSSATRCSRLAGYADGEVLKLRLLAWVLFSVVVSVVALGLIAYQLWDNNEPLHRGMEVLSGGELIITSVALAATSVGDVVVLLVLFLREGTTRLRYPGRALLLIGGAIVFLIFGSLLYGNSAAKQHETVLAATQASVHGQPDLAEVAAEHVAHLPHVTIVSLVSFGFALLLGASSIWFTAQQGQPSAGGGRIPPQEDRVTGEGSV